MTRSKSLPLETGHLQTLVPRDASFIFNSKSIEKLKEIMKESKEIADEERKRNGAHNK